MNIKQAIYTALTTDTGITDIFSTRIRPQFIAMDGPTPYVIFDRQSTETNDYLGGVSDLRMETFTFLVYADTRLEVENGKQAIQDALLALVRTEVENVSFSSVFEKTTSDDFDVRGVADQEPAYNEVVVFDFWAREA